MSQPGVIATIVAVAGRRIDAAGATPERFPLRNCRRVRDAISSILMVRPPSVVISSAACGTDLLALEVARELRIRSRVILPFAVDRFRASSVIDRPGDWGSLFDTLIADVTARRDLVILNGGPDDWGDEAYAATNVAILDEGDLLAASSGATKVALIAWDGESRGPDDLTHQFRTAATCRGWAIEEVRTL